jgi:hypothetical protein
MILTCPAGAADQESRSLLLPGDIPSQVLDSKCCAIITAVPENRRKTHYIYFALYISTLHLDGAVKQMTKNKAIWLCHT